MKGLEYAIPKANYSATLRGKPQDGVFVFIHFVE